jgi:hypothetical protein
MSQIFNLLLIDHSMPILHTPGVQQDTLFTIKSGQRVALRDD